MSINEKKASELLEKYYNGNTSIEEEVWLLNFLSQPNLSDKFIVDKKLFIELYQAHNDEIHFDPELLINNAISRVEDGKRSIPSINKYKKTLVYWSAAASIILIIGLGFFITNRQNNKFLTDSFDDPYLALQETKRVLTFMSEKLNVGQNQLESLSKINSATDALEPISEISRNLKYINIIEEIDQPKKIPFLRDVFYNKEED